MGQIIGSAAKPKRCNLNQLSQLETPAAGEHILVSSGNNMNAAGQGNFDCYIVGNGTDAATALELKKISLDINDVVNNLNKGGIDVPLSAEQGKVLNNEVSRLGQKVGIYNPIFELGNISISNTGWSYSAINTRVRLKQGQTLHLYPNDIIGLSDYSAARYYVGWRLSDGTYVSGGSWRTKDFIVQAEGDYVLVMTSVPEVTESSASHLASLFKLVPYLAASTIKKEVQSVEKRNEEIGKYRNYTPGLRTNSGGISADANYFITAPIPVSKDEVVNWEITGVDGDRFVLGYNSSGELSQTRAGAYNFWKIPDGIVSVIVCFPIAQDGAKVYIDNALVWEKTEGPQDLVGVQKEINDSNLVSADNSIKAADSYSQVFWWDRVPAGPQQSYNIEQNGKFGTSATYKHYRLPVIPGDVLRFVFTSAVRNLYMCFLSTFEYTPVSGGDIPMMDGTTTVPICYFGQNGGRIMLEKTIVIPANCYAIAFGTNSNINPKVYIQREKLDKVVQHYRQYIHDRGYEIRKRDIMLGQNADSFVFFSDYHIDNTLGTNGKNNFQHSPALIEYLREHTNTRKVFFGGDVFPSPNSDDERFELMDKFLNQFAFVPEMMTAVGNHEWRQSSNLNNDGRTYDFGSLAKKLEGVVTFGRDSQGEITQPYYFYDNPALKIRYFVLYTPGPVSASSYAVFDYSEQLAFVTSKTAELDASWKAVIVQHIVYESQHQGDVYDTDNFPTKLYTTGIGVEMKSFVVGHNVDSDVKIIAIFSGHAHTDFCEFLDGHCVSISENCDAAYAYDDGSYKMFPNTSLRLWGTVSEQSFDVYHINLKDRKILGTRIGYGSDKILGIDEVAVGVGNTISLTPTITPDSWVSQDESIATVVNGVVTGVSAGRVTIKARETGTPNGKWEYFNILVS